MIGLRRQFPPRDSAAPTSFNPGLVRLGPELVGEFKQQLNNLPIALLFAAGEFPMLLLEILVVVCGQAEFLRLVEHRLKKPEMPHSFPVTHWQVQDIIPHPGKLQPIVLGTLCFLLGFFTGYQGLIFACVKEITPPIASGMAIGVVNMSPFLAPAVLQPLFGRVLDLGWQGAVFEGVRVYPMETYHRAFLLLCGVAAIGAVSAFFIKETRFRNLVA